MNPKLIKADGIPRIDFLRRQDFRSKYVAFELFYLKKLFQFRDIQISVKVII